MPKSVPAIFQVASFLKSLDLIRWTTLHAGSNTRQTVTLGIQVQSEAHVELQLIRNLPLRGGWSP